MNLSDLSKPFPQSAISWRSQSLSRDGNKALALAYIDARDVMNRLDEVCGPENWSDSYTETPKGRIIGTIAIRIGDQWVSKSDGAGETDVEGDKGAISDALKRAAVKWGIGRYLYDIESPWVPCESYEKNGKRYWSKWTADPWAHVRGAPKPEPAKPVEMTNAQLDALAKLDECDTLSRLNVWLDDNKALLDAAPEAIKKTIRAAYSVRKKAIESMDRAAA